MTAVVVALGAAVALLTLLVVGVLRSHAEILKRLHSLGAGLDDDAPALPATPTARPLLEPRDFQVMPQVPSPPDRVEFGGVADISGLGPDGAEAVTVRVTGVEHDTIVAFLSSGCITCQKFWDAFRKHRKLSLPRGTRLVVVTKGPEAESASTVAGLAPTAFPTIMSTEAFDRYDVPGSPYFVHVHGPTGQVRGEGTGPDWDQVSSLLSQASGDAALQDSLAGSVVAKPSADAERESRIDRELNAAGIAPGDPSLYPSTEPHPPAADHEDDVEGEAGGGGHQH